MEYIVGVSEGGIALKKLLENRLPHSLGISVSEAGAPGCVRVCLEGKRSLFMLSDALADVIMENLQIRYIMQQMEKHPLGEKEKCDILIMTLKRLWYGDSGASWLEHQKSDVSNRIALCLLENASGVIYLDGVINFRMKDLTDRWRTTLDKCVAEHLSETERREFVRLLRYFVSMREPTEKCVYVEPRGEDYALLCGGGAADILSSGAEATAEDMLLSRLISISPEHIIIRRAEELSDSGLAELIRQVFVGRVQIER